MFPVQFNLKKDSTWNCSTDHEKAFQKVNDEVRKVAELTHSKRNKSVRIICDASKQGQGAVLKQNEEKGWKSIS